ncbi:MAG: prealbumin-like fold domain-containing protein, partial [Gaiellaceae bacterium]
MLLATAMVACIAFTPMAANAVHNEGLFELDGNIVDNPAAAGQDWSAFQAPALPGDTPPISTAFISDGFNGVNDTIYFGGGSQNNNDISSWGWSCGGVSTKSDIEHAYASAYIHSNELFLYFGADRYDPTGGTTNVGFWFLQDGGALQGGDGCPDANPAANTFSGQHADGDLFVFAEFTGGGGDSAVSIYEWASGGLNLLATKTSGSFCNADDSICAQTNSGTIPSTWPYTDNQGGSADGDILQGGFVEGGINLSSIYAGLGKDLPCVNRFLAQTGSSHPDTGVLEDFAGGSFNICSKLIVDKVVPSGAQTPFPFSVSGPGGYSDSFQLADGDSPHDSGQVKSGTYTVTETYGDPAVWNAPTVACKDQGMNPVSYGATGEVSIAPGATVTCTFTNTKKPQLTVVKKIVGGNGTTDAFDLKVDGATKLDDATSTAAAGTSSGAFSVSAGTHTVSETLGDGSTPVNPSDWVVSFSGDCDAAGQVTVQNDQSKTCTITNSKRPKLKVVKEIEGGDGSTFDISVDAMTVLDDAGDGANDERPYAPGTHTVSETFGDGGAIGADWTVDFSGDCDSSGTVTLAYGDEKTCTITNKRKPKLTVVKVIEGGNGAAFDLAVNGSTVLDDVSG